MARIIVYGEINLWPLYINVDGEGERKISGKKPQSISVDTGTRHIFATTVSKFERTMNSFSDGVSGAFSQSLQNSTNTTIEGELYFRSEDVLLIEVKQKGLKVIINNVLVSESEVDDYLNANQYNDREESSGEQKNKWVTLLLCVLFGVFGVHKFYEGKKGMGVLYLFTLGLFGFGVLIDFFCILFRKS